MELITGYKGTPHVTAEEDAYRNAGFIGSDSYITPLIFPEPINNEFLFECTKVNNNEVKIGVGQVFILGKQVFNNGDKSVAIESGGQGVKRADIVGLVYCQDEITGVETVETVAVKGTAGNEYVDPDYSDASAIAENGLYFAPMYRVKIDELEIVEIERIVKIRSLDPVTLFTSESGISSGDINLSKPYTDFKRLIFVYYFSGQESKEVFVDELGNQSILLRALNLVDSPTAPNPGAVTFFEMKVTVVNAQQLTIVSSAKVMHNGETVVRDDPTSTLVGTILSVYGSYI